MSNNNHYRFAALVLAVILLSATVMPTAVRAAGPWYVATTGDDNYDCLSPSTPCATIDGAIGKASPGDTVNVASGVYTGTSLSVVEIDKNLTLSGSWNATFTSRSTPSIIDGQDVSFGIYVNSATATVEYFRVENGFWCAGGGILNVGNLTLQNSTISNNRADDICGPGGGGIWTFGTLAIKDTTISDNVAIRGGGVYISGGSLEMDNVTLADNTSNREGGGLASEGFSSSIVIKNSRIQNNDANFDGGGIYAPSSIVLISGSTISGNSTIADFTAGGGIYVSESSLVINNSTISENTTFKGGGIYAIGTSANDVNINNSTIAFNTSALGGGIDNGTTGVFTIHNSLIAQNTGSIDGADCYGQISSGGYNLISNTSGCTFTTSTGDLSGVDPLLGPLQNNGGNTFTHALLSGSPAIDTGNPAGCTDQNNALLATDQRGVTRPQGGRCDIGAFELEVANPVIEVMIDIKPGDRRNRIEIEPGDDGSIQVALLSTELFNAPHDVDRSSLTFGTTGDENSLKLKGKKQLPDCQVRDANKDRRLDLVCKFTLSKTGFQPGDTLGILRGLTVGGLSIEGSDAVTVKLED